MSSWQKVYSDQLMYRAEIVKSVLLENDIKSVILSKKDSAYQFGHYDVMVTPDNVLQAIRIIKEDINFE
ncbi:MAG: DUF2007 domain-containing protein [bacterium]|nr:DUF2007 domain-containing protein [bacterium]